MRARSSSTRWRLAAALALASALVPKQALGYCRTTTCELGEETREEPCARDERGCVTEGKALHWPGPCLRYAVQLDGSPKSELDADQIQELMEQAFAMWQTAQCPGGGTPHFEITFQGFVSCHEQEWLCGTVDDNVNVIMFHDTGWPSLSSRIAVTSPSAGVSSGSIVDADMQFNSERFDFSANSLGPTLLTVMVHETGHFLGLGHSRESGALMSEAYESIDMSTNLLSSDDIAGICAVFPPQAATLSCPSSSPAYDTCQRPEADPDSQCASAGAPQESCSCRLVGAPSEGTAMGSWLLGASLAFTGWRRRRRGSRLVTGSALNQA